MPLNKSINQWLIVGLSSLLFCGLLSIFVVFLRIPAFGMLFINAKKIFDTSLVVHVNLSIYVWFFSVIAIIYDLNIDKLCTDFALFNLTNKYSLGFLSTGSLMIAISAFLPSATVIKVNYVPVINNILFFIGITFVGLSILLKSVFLLFYSKMHTDIFSISFLIIISFIAFFAAYIRLNENLTIEEYYEYLFYGMGHLIQMAFCQAIIFIYLYILNIKQNKILKFLLWLNVIFSLMGILIYIFYDDHLSINAAFSMHMKIFSGIVPTSIFLYMFLMCIRKNFFDIGVMLSIFLFCYGGLLGFVAQEGLVSVPAHYHGSIVAITVGMMRFIYSIFNYKNMKIANIQMIIYSIGQFLHITSLWLMGGYGALRKTTSMATSDIMLQILFAIGGLIAIIGGAIFISMILIYCFKNNRIKN